MGRAGKEGGSRKRRPYIGGEGRELQGLADAATLTAGFVMLALAVGFAVGLAVFGVMKLSTLLTNLVWKTCGGLLDVAWFSLAACTLGGLCIGVWTHVSRNRVRGLEEVMAEFKATGTYDLHGGGKAAVSFLLPLVFGGSIGFEAGLTGIIVAGCCWIRDKLKAAGLRVAQVADVTISASLSAIFGAPFAGLVAGMESSPRDCADGEAHAVVDVDAYDMRRGVKLVLYLAAAIGAFGAIELLSLFSAQPSGLPRFDAIRAQGAELLWALPCLVVAYAMALVFHVSDFGFSKLSERMGSGTVATVGAPVVAGVVLGACAMALPYVLFPGEEQSRELMELWQTIPAFALVATGFAKAVATPMCIRMGWVGGSFFPSIFAGVACGYGLAALTGADPMLMVTVTTSAFLAGVTRKPLLTVALLALCFPLTGIVWSGLAALVGSMLPLPFQGKSATRSSTNHLGSS